MLVIGDAVESVEGRLFAPMPAKVIRVAAGVGDRVARGDVLLVLEAMKMEHGVAAPADGVVAALAVAEGDLVEEGARSEEHTSELQSLMRISYAVFCLKKNITYKI